MKSSSIAIATFGSLLLSSTRLAYGAVFCDNEYNTSSCANTTFTTDAVYKCRGFLSCKDSTFKNTECDLYCQGDRSCKNVDYYNDDNDELWAYGYRSAEALTMSYTANDAYCYGYQSCLDIIFQQSTSDNDAEAHGYQSMYNAYIDYSDSVSSHGYEGLYYATINTTSVNDDELDITVYGYYGSYETDILCQDGITCNVDLYGYYASYETYLYCLRGSTCNVDCGETNGCVGMTIYAYSTSTVYFDCSDATECPTLEDAQASAKLMAYSQSALEIDNKFDKFMNDRLSKKYSKQYQFRQDRMREEKQELKLAAKMNNAYVAQYSNVIQSVCLVVFGIIFGMVTLYCYNNCCGDSAMAKSGTYSYQAIN